MFRTDEVIVKMAGSEGDGGWRLEVAIVWISDRAATEFATTYVAFSTGSLEKNGTDHRIAVRNHFVQLFEETVVHD